MQPKSAANEAKLLKRSVYATRVLVAVVLGLLLYPSPATAAKHAKLPAPYEHWLDEEVNYLITNQEKATFLSLTTNQDRDHFIESFWAIPIRIQTLPPTPIGKSTTAVWSMPIPTLARWRH